MPSTGVTERLVFGLLASAARLVPVPFLDDILRDTAARLMVRRILQAHGRTYPSSKVEPLYTDRSGCITGCFLFGLKLLLFPLRKVVTWVLAAKYLARDLSEAILLGRVLDRMLEAGRLRGPDEAALLAEADRIKTAWENAVRGTDMKLLQGILWRAVRSVKGLPRAALHALRRLRRKGDDADPTEGLSASDRARVDEGAKKIEGALADPQVQAFLEAFDARFDDNLRVLEARVAQT